MQKSYKRILILLILALGFGCKKAADLAKYKDQALALVKQYEPQIRDLAGKAGGLKDRIKSLPPTLPVVGDLGKLLDTHQGTIDKLQGMLANLPTQIADTAKSGKEAEVTAALSTATTEITSSISSATQGLAQAESKVVEAEAQAKAAAAIPPPPAEDFSMKLTTGFELAGAKDGIESQLVAFLADDARLVDKTTWFNFDRLTFKSGGAELDMEVSKGQLANIVEVLKAFPKAKLKIGGYTDSTGAAAANKKLSSERAEAVKKELAGLGVDASRLEAEGYGPEHPICPANDTDECKAKNRRISVRVTTK
jgi:outer membrane protein OmpA-like peptidoglycan-associated protein